MCISILVLYTCSVCCMCAACSIGGVSQGLGAVGDHWCGRLRTGDIYTTIPAGHRPRVERHSIRRSVKQDHIQIASPYNLSCNAFWLSQTMGLVVCSRLEESRQCSQAGGGIHGRPDEGGWVCHPHPTTGENQRGIWPHALWGKVSAAATCIFFLTYSDRCLGNCFSESHILLLINCPYVT